MTRPAKSIALIFSMWHLLSANATFAYTHADTLRGSNGRGRSWWDVQKYDLSVEFSGITYKSISGVNRMQIKPIAVSTDSMQIDLQDPMVLDSALLLSMPSPQKMTIVKDGNVWWVKYPFSTIEKGVMPLIALYFHGEPKEAVNPPWDGGFSWKTDKEQEPWISVSCQELGASVWWPCKDAQWDEPDEGMDITLIVANALKAVSNGRLVETIDAAGPMLSWKWQVKNPINNYDVTFYIGDYVHWHDTLMGEKGKLDLDYWVLHYNEEKARKHFEHVKQMIHCFEYWLGPYPFYEDGYKLVEAPYLGMEHQSAVAYGNQYRMGYLGHDRTGTGIGMNFDYITVHESAHEWYGNNITAKDIADMWVQEGITTYSESLYAECLLGKEKGQEYCRGEWRNVRNDKPIIGDYGVNNEGSGDMYDKGAAIMHMIRVMTRDDEKFRQTLRGLSSTFYHKTVTTAEIENYIAEHTGLRLGAFFDQYLRTTDIPELEYYVKDKELYYRFNHVVEGFMMPIPITSEPAITIRPTDKWQHVKWKGGKTVNFSNDFLITVK